MITPARDPAPGGRGAGVGTGRPRLARQHPAVAALAVGRVSRRPQRRLPRSASSWWAAERDHVHGRPLGPGPGRAAARRPSDGGIGEPAGGQRAVVDRRGDAPRPRPRVGRHQQQVLAGQQGLTPRPRRRRRSASSTGCICSESVTATPSKPSPVTAVPARSLQQIGDHLRAQAGRRVGGADRRHQDVPGHHQRRPRPRPRRASGPPR